MYVCIFITELMVFIFIDSIFFWLVLKTAWWSFLFSYILIFVSFDISFYLGLLMELKTSNV